MRSGMSVFAAVIFYFGLALEVCLVGVLLRKRLWRCYPYFAFLVLWIVAWNLLWFIFPLSEYANFYWKIDTVDVVLRFLVVWELSRHIFPKGSALNVPFSRGLTVAIAALMVLAVGIFWSFQTYFKAHSVWAALERSSNFTQAVMTLGLLFAARYYGIPLGRQIQSIAVAFGAWASISTANNAMIDLLRSFLPYWQIVRPLSFVALLGAWTWALWKLAPEPLVAQHPVLVPELSAWTESWNRTQSSLRRVKPS